MQGKRRTCHTLDRTNVEKDKCKIGNDVGKDKYMTYKRRTWTSVEQDKRRNEKTWNRQKYGKTNGGQGQTKDINILRQRLSPSSF